LLTNRTYLEIIQTGLEDCILPYVHFFLNNQINGCRLLLLTPEELAKLNVTKIGHQEIILDGVDLLKHLHYNFNSETLQSLALRLGCKSRALCNQLKNQEFQANAIDLATSSSGSGSASKDSKESNSKSNSKFGSNQNKSSNSTSANNSSLTSATSAKSKISTNTLFTVCDILNTAKTFISWIDR
jgi:hypothetical protein